MDQKNTYGAESIQVLKGLQSAREKLNPNLADLVKKRGDITKISNKFNIEIPTLQRYINEIKILSLFPDIFKSKAGPLAIIKVKRELELFIKNYDINKLEVRQLYRAVKEWKKRLEADPNILLTSLQHDLIIGSTFGDAYVRQRNKNCNFRVGHSKLQEKYLLWKYNILKEFTISNPKWHKRILNGHEIIMLELATTTHHVFNYYRKLFYKNGVKRITRDVLNLLNPRSLAIWLCDDGSYGNKQGYIVFCTNAYSLEEHKIIKKYFEEIFGLSPTIGFRDKKYYYLRFKQGDSKKLIEIVRPHIPNFMKYKIGEKND